MNKQLSMALVCGAVLMGCGGGGGGGGGPGPIAINASNSQGLVSDTFAYASAISVSNDLGGSSAAQVPVGVQVLNPQAVLGLVVAQLPQLDRYALEAKQQNMPVGVVAPIHRACSSSGSYDVTVTDNNNDGYLSLGESASIKFNACNQSQNLALSGFVTIRFNRLAGTLSSNAFSANITLVFNQLIGNSSHQSLSINGDLTVDLAQDSPNNVTTSNSSNALALAYETPTNTATIIASGFKHQSIRTTSGVASPHTYKETISLSGTLTRTLNGSSGTISIDTPTPLWGYDDENDPHAGVLLITGNNNSKVRATVQPTIGSPYAARVQLEVDADGDGNYESSNTLPWADL